MCNAYSLTHPRSDIVQLGIDLARLLGLELDASDLPDDRERSVSPPLIAVYRLQCSRRSTGPRRPLPANVNALASIRVRLWA
jgi:hypothetical protein